MQNQSRKFFYALVLLITLLAGQSYAQYFSTGTDPGSLKWSKIDSNPFQIIFPNTYEAQARRMNSFLKANQEKFSASLKNKGLRKFPIIIHPYSITSNGWTIWAPRRVELFPRSPINGLAEDYQQHLLIHEYRHMIQMDKLNQGITKAAGFVLGDQAVAAVVGLHMPGWFSEGDAVLTETLLTQAGRGRSALFLQALKAQWLSEKPYRYDKAIHGSYKDFVANEYVLGYHMVGMARMLGGAMIWSEALDDVAKKPWKPANMSRTVKKYTGFNHKGLYLKTMDWFKDYWSNQPLPQPLNETKISQRVSKEYTEYLKPYQVDSSSWLCLKKTLSRIPVFVKLTSEGTEQKIFQPGTIEGASFSFADNKIVWAEQTPDLRWEHRSYSDLFCYDIGVGKLKRITRKRRLFSPDLDQSGTRIACVELEVSGASNLVVLQLDAKNDLSRIKAPDNEVFESPRWDTKNDVIWVLLTGENGKRLVMVDPNASTFKEVIDFGHREVLDPVRFKEAIYFTAPSQGTQSLYLLDLESFQIRVVGSSHYGINHLNSNRQTLSYSVYTDKGYLPYTMQPGMQTERQIESLPNLDDGMLPLLEKAEGEDLVYMPDNEKEAEVLPYRKFTHLFKIHSWAPVFFGLSNYQLNPGIMVMSQNPLSSLDVFAGYNYSIPRKSNNFDASMSFSGWYPRITFAVSSEKPKSEDFYVGKDTLFDQSYWHHRSVLNIDLPLEFSKGSWYSGFISALSISLNHATGFVSDVLPEGNMQWGGFGIGFKAYKYKRMSHRDLNPRWGYIASLIGQAGMLPSNGGSSVIAFNAQFFLPGLLNNHSIKGMYSYQHLQSWPIPVVEPFILPRGMYDDYEGYTMSGKLDYAFPFYCPDLNLGSILYIKRLKANLFSDIAWGGSMDDKLFLTTGLDLRSDFYLLRMGVEFDAGVRILYNPIEKDWNFEALYAFSLQ